jgi:hypothetical protein
MYAYRVRATSATGNSAYSNEISVTTSTGTAPIIDFPNGFAGAAAQFKFNGASAKIVGANLQLTDGGATENASVFALNAVSVASFSTQFNFQIVGGTTPTADGMTFTIQGVANTALGGSGGGLGYAGIAKSVAIKFDLYNNAGEGSNSTGLYTNGAQPNAVNSVNLTGTGIDLHSGHVFNVSMVYNGTTLQVTIKDTVTLATATQSYTVNIPTIVGANTAFVGFTGGTGGLTAVQTVLNWTYTESAGGASGPSPLFASATSMVMPAPQSMTVGRQVTVAEAVVIASAGSSIAPVATGVSTSQPRRRDHQLGPPYQ